MNNVAEQSAEKRNLMTIDTFLFSNKLQNYKNEVNKIDRNFAKTLYGAIEVIQNFLDHAEIEDSDDNFKLIFSSLDNSVLQCRSQFHCRCCKQAIQTSVESFNKHLSSGVHLQNLREYSAKIEVESTGSQQSCANGEVPDDERENASVKSDERNVAGSRNKEKKDVLREKKNSKALLDALPARLKNLALNEEKLPKKTREFLKSTDITKFTNSLIKVGLEMQNSKNHIRICDHLSRRLSHTFPRVKVYTFGSYAIGLGHEATDLDIFIDTELCFYSKLSRRKMKDAIFQTQRILDRSGEWSNFEPVIHARTPILRAFCEVEKIDCDLSFSNGLSVCNTNLISYYINLQPVCKKIVLFVKFWSKQLNLGINSYMITLMVIFYLQQRNVVPSVNELQRRCKPVLINDWNVSFEPLPLTTLKTALITDYKRYLIDFFKFYGYEFDYANYAICVLTGSRVPKHIFDHGAEAQLPPVFQSFATYMSKINLEEADEVDDLLSNKKPLVIIDPFELIHNVGKGVQRGKLIKIVGFLKNTYGLLCDAKFSS